jgi:hypothetical protein
MQPLIEKFAKQAGLTSSEESIEIFSALLIREIIGVIDSEVNAQHKTKARKADVKSVIKSKTHHFNAFKTLCLRHFNMHHDKV